MKPKNDMKKNIKLPDTSASHSTDGKTHVVEINALKVMLLKDGSEWFAQGIEIDYAACGTSAADAQEKFVSGLAKTIGEHLKMHGTIEKFLKPAPEIVWKEFYTMVAKTKKVNVVTLNMMAQEIHPKKEEALEEFPYNKIEFLEPALAVA